MTDRLLRNVPGNCGAVRCRGQWRKTVAAFAMQRFLELVDPLGAGRKGGG